MKTIKIIKADDSRHNAIQEYISKYAQHTMDVTFTYIRVHVYDEDGEYIESKTFE
jgi:hypothetical protein